MLTEGGLALLLQLLDVVDESRVAVDFEFFIFLYLLQLLLLPVYLLIDHLVYLDYVSRCLISQLLTLIELIAKP